MPHTDAARANKARYDKFVSELTAYIKKHGTAITKQDMANKFGKSVDRIRKVLKEIGYADMYKEKVGGYRHSRKKPLSELQAAKKFIQKHHSDVEQLKNVNGRFTRNEVLSSIKVSRFTMYRLVKALEITGVNVQFKLDNNDRIGNAVKRGNTAKTDELKKYLSGLKKYVRREDICKMFGVSKPTVTRICADMGINLLDFRYPNRNVPKFSRTKDRPVLKPSTRPKVTTPAKLNNRPKGETQLLNRTGKQDSMYIAEHYRQVDTVVRVNSKTVIIKHKKTA